MRPLCHLPRETEVQDRSVPCLLRTSDSPPQAQGRCSQKSPGACKCPPTPAQGVVSMPHSLGLCSACVSLETRGLSMRAGSPPESSASPQRDTRGQTHSGHTQTTRPAAEAGAPGPGCCAVSGSTSSHCVTARDLLSPSEPQLPLL